MSTRKSPTLKQAAIQLTRGGLTADKIKATTSGLNSGILGELFYGVAKELETMEGATSDTAVGYYMAALADPEGPCFGEARKRLIDILLADALSGEQANQLFEGGLSTLKGLCGMDVGITPEGLDRCSRELAAIREATRHKHRNAPPPDSQ